MPDKTKILLHIKSVQTDINNQKSDMAFYAEGQYYKNGSSAYITYKESEISGMDGSTTTLKIDAEEVSLIRFGSITTKLVFQKGKRTISQYKTAYGVFDMTIDTQEVDLNMNKDDKSFIYLKYLLSINHQEPLTQELYISY